MGIGNIFSGLKKQENLNVDMELAIDGMGIVFYSPEMVGNIPVGTDVFNTEYNDPEQVARHIKKGDLVGFCTGSGGNYTLKFRSGYPSEEITNEYPVAARLGIDVRGDSMHVVDLFELMDWTSECPESQILKLDKGIYHITLNTKKPDSGVVGDNQIIWVHLNKLSKMPKLSWDGVPMLIAE